MSRVAATLMCCVALAGCTRQDAIPSQGSIEFRVDPARLGARYADASAQLALRAPAGWSAVPDSLIAEAMTRVRATEPAAATGRLTLVAMYRQEPEGASLAVSRFGGAMSAAARDSVALVYLRNLRAAGPTAKVDDGRFLYHGFEIVQFRAVDDRRVAFKLLVSRPSQSLVQLDYVVPRNVYSRELEAVESSIGSLEPSS